MTRPTALAHTPLTLDSVDEHDRQLVALTHPSLWKPPTPHDRYDLVVVGGGTAGLVSAIGAAGLGARVALIERHLLGGDCLVTGCVPSKALLRAAKAAHEARQASRFGVHVRDVEVRFEEVMRWVRASRAEIAPHDAAERVAGSGAHLFFGEARFTDLDKLRVGDHTLAFRRAVVATGGRAAPPPIPGLEEAGYLTNETFFELTELPRRLGVIGGGPIGCELSQAAARLGAEVTLVTDGRILPRDDPEASALLAEQLRADGVQLLEQARVHAVERTEGGKQLSMRVRGEPRSVDVDELLVATGRRANVEGLGLDRAGVEYDERRGVRVDRSLRSTNPRIYAAGDVAGLYQFTHAADQMARFVIRNALFFGRARSEQLVIPWATYTDPEVAHVGRPAAEAAKDSSLRLVRVDVDEHDRSIVDGTARGFLKAWVDRRGRLAAATIASHGAGDLIGELSLLMTHDLSLGTLSSAVHPYPTESELNKKLGDAYNRTRLTPFVRRLFELLLAVTRRF